MKEGQDFRPTCRGHGWGECHVKKEKSAQGTSIVGLHYAGHVDLRQAASKSPQQCVKDPDTNSIFAAGDICPHATVINMLTL